MELHATGVRKGWFSWIFRGSAFLHFAASVFMLFVLVQSAGGTVPVRSAYISQNETLVIVSWVMSTLAVLSLIGTFTILTFALDKTYRLILQWAWMISVIGGSAVVVNHFIQMTVIPALSELFLVMPSIRLAQHMVEWDQLLSQLVGIFSLSCFAISGLIYTGVMFRTRDFSSKLSWWSFFVWTILLLGTIAYRWIHGIVPVVLGVVIFIYIPWLWYVGEQVKPQLSQ